MIYRDYRWRALTAVGLAWVLCMAESRAEPFLYASVGGGSQLVKVDIGAGTVTAIGPFGQPGAFAVAISPQGKVFTITQGWPPNQPNPQMAAVDIATGEATAFGVSLAPEIFMGIGFSPDGRLYGVNAASGTGNQGSLYLFNAATGEGSKVGITGGCGLIMDLAYHPDGTMYGVDPTSLYRINPDTGEATLVSTVPGHNSIMGLAIDDDGNFYISEIVGGAPLLRLDPVTGATNPVPGVTLDWPHGLEIIPTPRSRPIDLAFEKSAPAPTPWQMAGNVDFDFDGVADGGIYYIQDPGARVAGKTVHFGGNYTVVTDFYSFIAHLDLVLNTSNNSVSGDGVITTGWLDGARVHLEAQFTPPGSAAGVIRIMPGSAD